MLRRLSASSVLRAIFTLAVACIASTIPACATIGVLVGEPYGAFGTMMPAGHSALYFDHICAETPTTLRQCQSGEPGTAVARYHRIADLDWLATPIVPFLYGVDDPAHAPTFVTLQLETELRQDYRKTHLTSIVPDHVDADGHTLPPRKGEWVETIGSTFDRRLFLYEFDTTPEQDAILLAWLRDRPNQRRYSLRRANCADFTADAVNLLYPKAIRRNRLADFGVMTPKQVARALETFGQAHPELHPRVYEIPQLPGTLRRSRPLRGGAESFLKTKRYLAFFLITQPELVLADWAIYQSKGKWKPEPGAAALNPEDWQSAIRLANNGHAGPKPSDPPSLSNFSSSLDGLSSSPVW